MSKLFILVGVIVGVILLASFDFLETSRQVRYLSFDCLFFSSSQDQKSVIAAAWRRRYVPLYGASLQA